MSVLITGGAGFIGSHMAWLLHDCGRNYTILDNLSTGSLSLVPDDSRVVIGDVRDVSLVTETLNKDRISTVIHFAGSILIPESVSNPLKYYDNNTVATAALLAACKDAGTKNVIFSSTAAVYGDPGLEIVSEENPVSPISPYGRSKLMSEWILRDAASAYDIRYAILRYFNVAGADIKGRTGQIGANTTHLIRAAIRSALGHGPRLSIFGTDYPTADGTGVRDFIHVCDLVSAHRATLEHLEAGGNGGIFNCGYGRGYSVRQIIDVVERVSGQPLNAIETERRPGDAPQVVANVAKLREGLNWHPSYDNLEAIISSSLAWERRLPGAVPSQETA